MNVILIWCSNVGSLDFFYILFAIVTLFNAFYQTSCHGSGSDLRVTSRSQRGSLDFAQDNPNHLKAKICLFLWMTLTRNLI